MPLSARLCPARWSSVRHPSSVLRSRGGLDSSAAPADEAAARKTFHTIQLKNGHKAVGMAVPETLMSSVVAERAPDGSLSIHHDDHGNGTEAPEVTR